MKSCFLAAWEPPERSHRSRRSFVHVFAVETATARSTAARRGDVRRLSPKDRAPTDSRRIAGGWQTQVSVSGGSAGGLLRVRIIWPVDHYFQRHELRGVRRALRAVRDLDAAELEPAWDCFAQGPIKLLVERHEVNRPRVVGFALVDASPVTGTRRVDRDVCVAVADLLIAETGEGGREYDCLDQF